MVGKGLNASLTWGLGPEQEQFLRLYRSLGVEWLRIGLNWRFWEYDAKGEILWDEVDPNTQAIRAAWAAGFKIMLGLNGSPNWAGGVSTSIAGGSPPNDVNDFKDACIFAMKQWGKYIAAFQVWNEPNTDRFWYGGADAREYVDLHKAAYAGIKSQDPTMPVVFAGPSLADWQWIEACYAYEPNLGNYYDVMACQPYPVPLNNTPDATTLGSTNVLTNGGFDNPANYLEKWGPTSAITTRETTIKRGGVASAKLVVSGGEAYIRTPSGDRQACSPSTPYSYSFWTMPTTTAHQARCEIAWYNAAGTQVRYDNGPYLQTVLNKWMRPQITATSPSDAVTCRVYMFAARDVALDGEVYYVDAGQLEVMGAPTEFAPKEGNTTRTSLTSFLGYREIRAAMVANGDSAKPLWLTEFGWSDYSAGVSATAKAANITRAYELIAGDTYAKVAFLYMDVASGADDWEGQLGIAKRVGPYLQPTPATEAFKAVQKPATGCRFRVLGSRGAGTFRFFSNGIHYAFAVDADSRLTTTSPVEAALLRDFDQLRED